MHLSPREIDKLILHNAGFLAQKRYARGLALNYIEAVALISAQLLEFIRDGDPVIRLMEKGKHFLGFADVMSGIPGMIPEVQVEGTFPDGTKLVTVHDPICTERGDSALALYGSGLTRTAAEAAPGPEAAPGQTLTAPQPITLNPGRSSIELTVLNNGDRPVQVGSHYPFFEVNPHLRFNRDAAFGRRLDIPAGTAVRFEPGESRRVNLVEIAGARYSCGANALINGPIDKPETRVAALERIRNAGYAFTESD